LRDIYVIISPMASCNNNERTKQMRVGLFISTICVFLNCQIALADELPRDIRFVYLSCSLERCEDKHYDIGTKISTTTDCLNITTGSTDLSFPANNGSYTSKSEAFNGTQVKEVTDSTLKQTLKYELGGVRNVSTIIINRITGKYSEYKEQYSAYGTDRSTLSGVCFLVSDTSKRKF